jgi:hypothetical protein
MGQEFLLERDLLRKQEVLYYFNFNDPYRNWAHKKKPKLKLIKVWNMSRKRTKHASLLKLFEGGIN